MSSALSDLAKEHRLLVFNDLRYLRGAQDKSLVDQFVSDARNAHHFILGDEASLAVGKWIAGCEDILLDQRQFAKPPFPKIYVEISISELHRGIGRATSGPPETSDDRLGYLVVDRHVRTICTGRGTTPIIGLWQYWTDTPDPSTLLPGASIELENWMRIALQLGSTTDVLKDEAQRAAIARGTRITSTIPHLIKTGKEARQLISASAGELRTLWAILLLINQHRNKINLINVPRQIANTAKGRKVYAAHTLISIPLHEPQEARRIYYPSQRASPIGHMVRGHWMRFHLHKGCIHQWPPIPDDNSRFHCARCNGWRIWCKPHARGDTSRGFATHGYEMIP